MNLHELTAYFENKELPATLRLDRACTQHDVKEAVQRNIDKMKANTDDWRAKHKLEQIMNALETPYDGLEIPKL